MESTGFHTILCSLMPPKHAESKVPWEDKQVCYLLLIPFVGSRVRGIQWPFGSTGLNKFCCFDFCFFALTRGIQWPFGSTGCHQHIYFISNIIFQISKDEHINTLTFKFQFSIHPNCNPDNFWLHMDLLQAEEFL